MNHNCRISIVILLIFLIHSCKKDDDSPFSMTDKDGNVYTSVTIGTQVWMVENLKTTKYLNGDLIGTTSPDTLDISGESTPKYQWSYDGNESNVAVYGRLYTWYAATDSRGICPTGWHVPTDKEWDILKTFLGGWSVAGGKIKERGTTHWTTPNTGATNETGFTALPSGSRVPYGIPAFQGIGFVSYWWSATETASATSAYYQIMDYTSSYLLTESWWSNKQFGFSVRCLRD